jgi:NodT family efflux transporter outer membrane factor (OMF) lipoprotein
VEASIVSTTWDDAGGVPVSSAFWRAFDEPGLDAAVDEALGSQLELAAARARLDAAAAVVRQQRAGWWPAIDGVAGVASAEGGATVEVGLAASYELDLWGRNASAVRAQVHRREAEAAQLQAARLSVAAEVASTWIALGATRELLDLAEQQIEANEQMSDVVRARFLNGVVRQADSLRQDRLVEQTRAEQIARREDLAVLQHRLAVLLGRAPGSELPALPDGLPTLPAMPAAGVPSEVLRRRPDVVVAEQALYAADADLAVAITDQFPRVTLGASAVSAVDGGLQGWVLSLGADLLAPLFAGGQRRAEVRRRRALLQAEVATYGQTLLVAAQEVRDALARNRLQAEAVASIDRQVDLAARTADGLRLQYVGGLDVGYLDVLTAQTAAQQLLRQQITERQRELQLRVDLYRALAGPVPEESVDEP